MMKDITTKEWSSSRASHWKGYSSNSGRICRHQSRIAINRLEERVKMNISTGEFSKNVRIKIVWSLSYRFFIPKTKEICSFFNDEKTARLFLEFLSLMRGDIVDSESIRVFGTNNRNCLTKRQIQEITQAFYPTLNNENRKYRLKYGIRIYFHCIDSACNECSIPVKWGELPQNSDGSISLTSIFNSTMENRKGSVPASFVLRPSRKVAKKESEIES